MSLLLNINSYLELYIDQHLTWQQYFDYIVPKAYIAQLYIAFSIYSCMLILIIKFSLFPYWIPCLAKQVKAMERIHSKVTFTVLHLRDKLFSCFYYSLVEHHKFHALVATDF